MNYLLDTCVISELVAKRSNPRVVAWVDRIEEPRLYLSVITIGEIRKGIEKLADSRRKTILRAWLDDQLLVRFSERILPLDIQTLLEWGRLAARLESKGKPMSALDSLIAASALARGLALVTRNENDFQDVGVTIINPWTLDS
ncbi:MAG: type II toxin-antitoxin system VapC family toxin [Chloroflexi bacterium]|nr:type II toxin-antitoxin system VapC family toxin [Chloroflexota bacterium]